MGGLGERIREGRKGLAFDARHFLEALYLEQPEGTLLPELVQWLSSAALDEPIGTIGAAARRDTAAIVTALIS